MDNVKNILNVIRSKFYKIAFAVYMFLYGIFNDMLICFAGNTDASKELEEKIVSPLTTIVNILLAVIQIAGVIYLIKSIADLLEAIGAHDQSGIWRSIKGIAAGALLIAIKLLLKLFGYEG